MPRITRCKIKYITHVLGESSVKLSALVTAGLLTLLALSVQAAMYKYVDENGRVHYTDKPPADAQLEPVQGQISSYASSGTAESGASEGASAAVTRNKRVILYSTSWCGVCKRAKSYMNQNGIRYTEYDIEKTEKGRRDYTAMNGKGVPILLVGDRRMNGFSAQKLEAMLATP